MTTRRLFVAVPLAEAVKREIATVQDAVCRVFSERGRTCPDALHLTLRFLGAVEEARIPDLRQAVGAALSGVTSFTGRLDGLTGFGPKDAPRVVVIGAEPVEAWRNLAGRVESAVRESGWEPEHRPFRPHITIHRPKCSGRVPAVQVPPVSFEVDRVVLYESRLTPARAVYTALAEWTLTGSQDNMAAEPPVRND